jgi:UDP-2,4-diacetamido-2,4,6-trideoxy-beta-L-altropyranose hydrolase
MSKPRHVVFRADADRQIGGGHVMRCLTIAAGLRQRGWDCAFASKPETELTTPALQQAGYRIIAVEGEPARDASIITEACGGSVNLVVIDHPTYTASEERSFRSASRWRMAIDGQRREHDTEILLDPNPDHDNAHLRGTNRRDCEILAGAEYIPLNAAITEHRPASLRRRADNGFNLKNVLVTLGAGNPGPALVTILEGLAAFDRGLSLTVLATTAVQAAKAAAAELGLDAAIFDWRSDVGPLLLASDLVIGAGGTSVWERCCLGVPSLTVATADNQLRNQRYLTERLATIDCGTSAALTPATVTQALGKLTPEILARLSRNSAELVDGRGTERVAEALTRIVPADG